MKTGDKITILYDREEHPGTVIFASPNGKSLMLGFDAILGGHVGMMPVLQDDDGVYRSIVTHEPVALSLKG